MHRTNGLYTGNGLLSKRLSDKRAIGLGLGVQYNPLVRYSDALLSITPGKGPHLALQFTISLTVKHNHVYTMTC